MVKKRYLALLALPTLMAINLAYAGVTGDAKYNLAKITFCVRGVMPTVATTGLWTTTVQNIHWGPEYFPMTARFVSVPGFVAGYLSGPYCPGSPEALAVQEQLKNPG